MLTKATTHSVPNRKSNITYSFCSSTYAGGINTHLKLTVLNYCSCSSRSTTNIGGINTHLQLTVLTYLHITITATNSRNKRALCNEYKL